MREYQFKSKLQVFIFFLYLINTIIGSIYLALSAIKYIEINQTNFLILFLYFILTIIAFGEILLKDWHDKKNKT